MRSIRTIFIEEETPISDALRRLNEAHLRILLVVGDEQKLLGVVTDSNFRRAMISERSFGDPVSTIMTRDPVTMQKGADRVSILQVMQQRHVRELPIVDDNGVVVDLVLIEDALSTAPDARVAVVMSGGLGQRLRPLTETVPKPLIKVGGRPILFTLLDQLIEARFDAVYLTLNYMAELIEDAVSTVDRYRELVRFVREPTRLGTAGSLSFLPEKPRSPFLVTNGDLLTKVDFEAMLRFHAIDGHDMTVAVREHEFKVPYGVVDVEHGLVTALREKPKLHHLVNAGVYVLSPACLDLVPHGVYFDATDLVSASVANGHRVGAFPIHEYWIDVGQHSELLQAQQEYEQFFKSSVSNEVLK